MTTLADLRDDLNYDAWANARVLRSLEAAQPARPAQPPGAPEQAVRVLGHILGAQRVWLARLRGQDTSAVAIWPDLSLDECAAHLGHLQTAYDAYLAGLTEADLSGQVTYRNSRGEPFETAVRDILRQVFRHGAYHRGQIALLLREQGHEPAGTDFITFVREGRPRDGVQIG